MPNALIRANAKGLPKMTRRAFAAGLAAAPTLPAAALAAPPVDRGTRVAALADEISRLLEGTGMDSFTVSIRPAINGIANHSIIQANPCARVRLKVALDEARDALDELHPGNHRIEHSVEGRFILIIDDDLDVLPVPGSR